MRRRLRILALALALWGIGFVGLYGLDPAGGDWCFFGICCLGLSMALGILAES